MNTKCGMVNIKIRRRNLKWKYKIKVITYPHFTIPYTLFVIRHSTSLDARDASGYIWLYTDRTP